MPALEGSGNQAGKALGKYVQDIVREQFFPLGKECYEELLGRNRRASGRMVLNVVVAGERAVGGVVDSVELGPDSTVQDEAFATCIRESMYAVEFDAPPDGHEQIDFTYPVMFVPGGQDAGSG
jgi:hypothetical protein